MKNYFKKFIYFSTVALLLASCDQKEDIDYTAKVYEVAGELTVQLLSPTVDPVTHLPKIDRTIDVNFSSSKEGILYYAIDRATAVTPSASDLVNSRTGLTFDNKISLSSNETISLRIDDTYIETINKTPTNDIIYGGFEFAVFSVMASKDGILSEVKKTVFTTPNNSENPVFLGNASNPSFESAGINPFAPVRLAFNEPVFYQGGDIKFTAFNSGREIIVNDASDLSLTAASINVNTHGTFEHDDFIIVTWDAGTFKDIEGNNVASLSGFSHYFRTRLFTAPEAAALMVGTYNYETVMYGGSIENYYTPRAQFFLPRNGTFELKLDPSDPSGSTLLGANLFSPLNDFDITAPENLKIKFGADGRLAILDEKQLCGIPFNVSTTWIHYSSGLTTALPGFYSVTNGTINHYLSLTVTDTEMAFDDIDYNYTRIGTFAKSTPQLQKELRERNQLIQGKIEQHKTYKKLDLKIINEIK